VGWLGCRRPSSVLRARGNEDFSSSFSSATRCHSQVTGGCQLFSPNKCDVSFSDPHLDFLLRPEVAGGDNDPISEATIMMNGWKVAEGFVPDAALQPKDYGSATSHTSTWSRKHFGKYLQ
jgi:hypothetical protein